MSRKLECIPSYIGASVASGLFIALYAYKKDYLTEWVGGDNSKATKVLLFLGFCTIVTLWCSLRWLVSSGSSSENYSHQKCRICNKEMFKYNKDQCHEECLHMQSKMGMNTNEETCNKLCKD